jgi:hypothetical protein
MKRLKNNLLANKKLHLIKVSEFIENAFKGVSA